MTDFPQDTKAETGRNVYVRPIAHADLPEEMREQAEGLDNLYAVHTEDGNRLAVVADRDFAFDLARQHDYAPHAVH
ncbi:DUF1150 family protein [Planktotalea sp.]|uniref:DUF1150 family protein n=1 Tax=Planktotalea sp. TaxID=2029877 RepID=UPI00329884A8